MAAALTFLFTGQLLQGTLCGEFKAIMPKAIEVLKGSCVNIPCSFDIIEKHESNLDHTCKAIWFNENDHSAILNGKLTGDLTKKDCTTIMNGMESAHSKKYVFRVDCANALKFSFSKQAVDISVKADPPRPTLTPSTLEVKEGTSVSLNCSAPAPCLLHPPTLTWSPILGDSQETMEENHDKTKVKTSVLNFTASYLHHGEQFSCTATYNKQDGSTVPPVSISVTAAVSFPPRILHSSNCNKTASQFNCSCETVGNPSPALHWYLDGVPVNHSDKFAISTESLSGTGLLSIITVNQPDWKHLSTLVCRSSNSLGSASQRFCVNSLEQQTSTESYGQVTLLVFITTVTGLLLLVCALLCVIRAQKTHHNLPKSQCTSDSNTVAISQLLPSSEGNEVPHTTEEAIYVNSYSLREADVPHSLSRGASKNSEMKNEEGSGVVYASVKWKSKSKKKKQEDSVELYLPGNSFLEERCMVGGMCRNVENTALEIQNLYAEVEPTNVKKEVQCEYAQVNV